VNLPEKVPTAPPDPLPQPPDHWRERFQGSLQTLDAAIADHAKRLASSTAEATPVGIDADAPIGEAKKRVKNVARKRVTVNEAIAFIVQNPAVAWKNWVDIANAVGVSRTTVFKPNWGKFRDVVHGFRQVDGMGIVHRGSKSKDGHVEAVAPPPTVTPPQETSLRPNVSPLRNPAPVKRAHGGSRFQEADCKCCGETIRVLESDLDFPLCRKCINDPHAGID